MSPIHLLFGLLVIAWTSLAGAEPPAAAVGSPLVVGGRVIHTFRAPLGMFSAAERADSARRRIEQAFEAAGEGWTSVKPVESGLQVELDGKPLFLVVPGDARALAGETPDDLANQASRILQKAWREAQERKDPRVSLEAGLWVALATLLTVAGLVLLVRLLARLRRALTGRLAGGLRSAAPDHVSDRLLDVIPTALDRLLVLLGWVLGLLLVFAYLSYSLGRFPQTRAVGEGLSASIFGLAGDALTAVAASLPGVFVAIIIFLMAWAATRITGEFFSGAEARPATSAWLNEHTAPTTRRLVNAALWLFAVAMAYPYLPGSHTEAFKGLSVMVGLMVSIGASGVVGQIASGMMIVYTYALKKGEYVRIQEYEGVVTELGLFVTRLRTGQGEEISLPNAYVLGNVTRNLSRPRNGSCALIDTTVTIGYDVPWRQVRGMLLEAAASLPETRTEPPPQVMQTALEDFYVAYKLVIYVDAAVAAAGRARVASNLHAAILDAFNRNGVQIMSPHYEGDPPAPKVVPESAWHLPPARE